ncbi:hypothetical protein [Phytoactinopolyspora limicola]|uniref:hypothetical protein n=1 Tax=Phytoactinopolyspora limicola TaxID=2715536 RepID=UPI00140AB9D2|nr:hypothetical protein [Phytoactinopolyspora limicola]
MDERRILYSEQRPYVVPETLEELTGPTQGEVTLPNHLDWSEQGTYNLDDRRELSVMYERVLREAGHVRDLRRYVNGVMLRRVWPHLFLPHRVRTPWEERFPELIRTGR